MEAEYDSVWVQWLANNQSVWAFGAVTLSRGVHSRNLLAAPRAGGQDGLLLQSPLLLNLAMGSTIALRTVPCLRNAAQLRTLTYTPACASTKERSDSFSWDFEFADVAENWNEIFSDSANIR
jgi:hypothetical protein